MDIDHLNMRATIKLHGESEVLYQAVKLENMTFGEHGHIFTQHLEDGISVLIKGEMSIGTMKYTIDDLLKSVILAESIAGVVSSE